MTNRIILADGTEIIDGSIVKSAETQILVSVPGTDLVGAVTIFNNLEKTAEMVCEYSAFRRIYKGYTHIGSVFIDTKANSVNVYMTGDNVSFEESFIIPERYLPEEMVRKHTEGASANG